MNPSPWMKNRLLVPRWTTFAVTTVFGELASPQTMKPKDISIDLNNKISAWQNLKNLDAASELIETALVESSQNIPNKAVDSAQWVISENSNATNSLKNLAKEIIDRSKIKSPINQIEQFSPKILKPKWRDCLSNNLHNPLAWVELALLDVIANKNKRAQRSMQVALQLAPENRHVIRSAARMYLHLRDPKRAYKVILDCPALRTDPWLVAAEISISLLLKKGPLLYKSGRFMVNDDKFSNYHKSELSGALGTLEISGGNMKKAKKFLKTSLLDPTGNALAQIEWDILRNPLEHIFFPDSNNPNFYEALIFKLIGEENYPNVPQLCQKWSNIEPHTLRPYEIGSTIACVNREFDKAIAIAESGLELRKNSDELLNSYAFSLIHTNKLKEAKTQLDQIKQETSSQTEWLISQANRGLLAMREKKFDLGESFYQSAIDGFIKNKEKNFKIVAMLFRARELIIGNVPNSMEKINEAISLADPENNISHRKILKEINDYQKLSNVK